MPASSNPLSSFVAFSRLGWFLLGGVAFLPRALRTALLFPIRSIQVLVVTGHFGRLIASTMVEHRHLQRIPDAFVSPEELLLVQLATI